MVKENHKPVLIVIAGPFKRYTDDIPEWALTILK